MSSFFLTIFLFTNFLLSQDTYGSGLDGYLGVANTVYIDEVRSKVNQPSYAGEPILYVISPHLFEVGDNIFIHQMIGGDAGIYEENYVSAVGSSYLTLLNPLANTYQGHYDANDCDSSCPKAQVLKIFNYSQVEIFSSGIIFQSFTSIITKSNPFFAESRTFSMSLFDETLNFLPIFFPLSFLIMGLSKIT